MKTFQYMRQLLLACFIIATTSACSDDQKAEEKPKASIEFESDNIDLSSNRIILPIKMEGCSYQIAVTSSPEVTWEVQVTEGENFVTANPEGKQKEGGNITITVSANDIPQERIAKVIISSSLSTNNKELVLKQEAVAEVEGEMSFAVLADLHYGRRTGTEDATIKIPRALEMIMTKQPKVKNIFICGDMTDGGNETEYRAVDELFNKNLPKDVNVYFMLGNHERYNQNTQQYFNDIFSQNIHQYIEQGGYPFITISVGDSWAGYDDEAVEFLKKHLRKAAQDYPDKPIFVFSHAPSEHETAWGPWLTQNQLHETLSNYRQVIHFTGHSHFSIEDERSIKQDKFTWINVGPGYYGTVSELDVNDIYEERYPATGENVTEGLIVDCGANADVQVTRLDTKHNTEIKTPWIIKAPHDGSQFTYTDSRTGGSSPVFSNEVTIKDLTDHSCTVVIPQATDDDLVAKYRVEIKKDKATSNEIKTYQVYSQCFLREDMPQTIEWKINGLTDNTLYTVIVKAIDSFGEESAPKECNFTTPKWVADAGTMAPTADLIDIMFQPGGVANNIANSSLKAVPGNADQKPEIVYNDELKMYVSKYNNNDKQFFKIDYQSNNNFKDKIKDKFTYEVYCKTNNTARQCPFSGLQTAFLGLQMNEDGSNKYYAMFYCTKGGYQRILYPSVETSLYHHYIFTFDGRDMNAYLNGKLIGSIEKLSGDVKISSNSGEQWMCIGGDTPAPSANAYAQFPFQGEVAFCRIHSKAVSRSEAYRLYEQIEKRKGTNKFDDLKDKLSSLSGDNLTEGWKLMNDITTTEAEITTFLNKIGQ